LRGAMPDIAMGVCALVIGNLFGTLVYLISEAFWPQDPVCSERTLSRAVVRVPESRCRSVRCALARRGQTEHLVEVQILERGTTLVKVKWPRTFAHLEEWIYRSDLIEQLKGDSGSTRLAADLERWLGTLDPSDDISERRRLTPGVPTDQT
jgi:hypothetical protein